MTRRLGLAARLVLALVPLLVSGPSQAYEYLGSWQHARLDIRQLHTFDQREYSWQVGGRPAVTEERLADLLAALHPAMPSSTLEVPLAFFLDHLGWSTWELVSVEMQRTAQGQEASLWFRSGNNAPFDGGDARARWQYATLLVPSSATPGRSSYQLQTGNEGLSHRADTAAELYARISGEANAPRLEPEEALEATFELLCQHGYQVVGSIQSEGLAGLETRFLLKREHGRRALRDYEPTY